MSDSTEQKPAHPLESRTATAWHWLLHPPVQIALVVLLGLAVYLHTLHAPFLLDDRYCITENPAIMDVSYLLDFDKVRDLNIWIDIKNNIALRPVVYWSFAFNYRLGGLDPFGYHLVNIAIHLLNAVLVYLLARVTLGRLQTSWSSPRLTGLFSCLVALLFVVHPLQTQAVTFINQRFTSMVTLFYLAGLLLYIYARLARRPGPRWSCYVLALLITVLAMKTKSIAFTLPFAMLLYDFFFLDGNWRQRLLWVAPFALTLLIIPGTLFWLVASDGVDDPRSSLEQSLHLVNYSDKSQWDYLRTQFGVILTYLRLFFLPVRQNLIPYYPIAPSFFSPRGNLVPLLLLSLLFGTAVRMALHDLKAGLRSPKRLIAFGILWFFITISMSSSIIPLDAPMLEYRVYLPSFGFFLAVMAAVAMAVDSGRLSFRIFAAGTMTVLLLLAGATWARNDLYNDGIRMLEDIIEKNQEATPARVDLAFQHMDAKRYTQAIAEYTEILKRIPNDPNMITNLGYCLSEVGRWDEATQQFLRALEIAPDHLFAHANLGNLFRLQGKFAIAEKELLAAVKISPDFGFARGELATLYQTQGRFAEAIEQYRVLERLYPGNPYALQQIRVLEEQLRARKAP